MFVTARDSYYENIGQASTYKVTMRQLCKINMSQSITFVNARGSSYILQVNTYMVTRR